MAEHQWDRPTLFAVFFFGGITLLATTPLVLAAWIATAGGALGLLLSFTPLRDWQVPLPERPKRITVPDDWSETLDVRTSYVNESWHVELEEFWRYARHFWDALRERYGRFGVLGQPGEPQHLSGLVEWTPWPDRGGSGESDPTFVQGFATRLYQNDTSSFEGHRHDLAYRAYRWWSRANDATDGNFEAWLGRNLKPAHLNTVKLLWYVDLAHGDYIGHGHAPDFRPYVFLRRLMEGRTVSREPHGPDGAQAR